MHSHDIELILALADGSLDPASSAAAEAEIAGCAQCAADLATQREALAVLAAAPAVSMNDLERARLHRTLQDELGLSTRAVASARPSRSYRWFGALAGAAAALLAFVVVVPGIHGGGVDAGSADTTSADDLVVAQAPATTMAAATDEGAGMAGDGALREMSGGDQTGTDAGEENDAAVTTVAAAETTTVPPVTLGTYTLYSTAEVPDLAPLSDLAAEIAAARSLDALGPPSVAPNARLEVFDQDRCATLGWAAAPDVTEAYIIGLSGINDVEVVIVAYVTGDFDDVLVVAHDLETCEILATSE